MLAWSNPITYFHSLQFISSNFSIQLSTFFLQPRSGKNESKLGNLSLGVTLRQSYQLGVLRKGKRSCKKSWGVNYIHYSWDLSPCSFSFLPWEWKWVSCQLFHTVLGGKRKTSEKITLLFHFFSSFLSLTLNIHLVPFLPWHLNLFPSSYWWSWYFCSKSLPKNTFLSFFLSPCRNSILFPLICYHPFHGKRFENNWWRK